MPSFEKKQKQQQQQQKQKQRQQQKQKQRQQQGTNYLSYFAWTGVIVAIVVAAILNIPEPELDWDNFVLPMTNKYVGLFLSDEASDLSTIPLKGINVVITGATSGIGRGMTEGLSKLGATIIAVGRSPDKLKALQQEVSTDIITVVADYTDLDTVAKAADEINNQVEHIDILFNNAGIHEGIYLWGNPTSKQGYDRIWSVNFLSHVLLTEKLAPTLQKSPKPVVAQMSSSFHWVGDWSDLIPTTNGGPPPASVPGGTGGIFRTQRGYGNTKLANIFHSRALKRRQPDLAKARIVRYEKEETSVVLAFENIIKTILFTHTHTHTFPMSIATVFALHGSERTLCLLVPWEIS